MARDGPPPAPAPDATGAHALARRLWRAPYLLLSLTMLFWSGNAVVGRAVHDAVPPVTLAFLRWAIASAIVLGVGRDRLRRDLPELVRHWRILLVLSALGIATFNAMLYAALHSTTAINALLLQSTMPLVIVLCTFLLFGERPGLRQLAGLLVSLAGAALITARGSLATLRTLTINPGDMLVLLAVVLYALYSALLRRQPRVHPLSLLGASFAVGGAMLAPFAAWELAAGARLRLDAGALAAIGYVAVFPSFLAYLCFNRGVQLIGANRAGQFMHLMPFFGSGLAIVFLGEAFHAYHAEGIGLIGAGIALATVGARPVPPQA
ncbi:MAG: DMT family transporter [Rhodospirillaceae bacterium]|nr:DMT family transporter [Rhodospirillaceae bacterium]